MENPMQKLMLNTLKVKSSNAIIEIKEVLEQLESLSNAYIKLEYASNMNKRVKKAIKQLNKGGKSFGFQFTLFNVFRTWGIFLKVL